MRLTLFDSLPLKSKTDCYQLLGSINSACLKSCECDQVSEKGAEVAETSTIRAVAVRLSAPKPQRGRLWARTRAESVGKEGRGGGSEQLLAVGRCLHQQGRLQLGAKVEEVNIV